MTTLGAAIFKAALLCFASLSFVACSEEADESDRGKWNAVPESNVAAGGGATGSTDETESYLTVEKAVLSSARESNMIHVWVRFGGSEVWPYCFLMDGPTKLAVDRAIERQDPSLAPRRIESLWAAQDSTEKSLTDDDTLLWIFHEDPDPHGEAADLRATPFFAACTGDDGRRSLQDAVHVEGTPEPSS